MLALGIGDASHAAWRCLIGRKLTVGSRGHLRAVLVRGASNALGDVLTLFEAFVAKGALLSPDAVEIGRASLATSPTHDVFADRPFGIAAVARLSRDAGHAGSEVHIAIWPGGMPLAFLVGAALGGTALFLAGGIIRSPVGGTRAIAFGVCRLKIRDH